MQQFPYFTPQILTDQVFIAHGGSTGTSSVAQRQIAYLLAEEQVTEDIRSFLKPTIVTGTAYYRGGSLYETEFGHLQRVLLVSANSVLNLDPLETEYVTGAVLIRNSQYGLIDVVLPSSRPHSINVVYESGLSTGTATQPAMLIGLTLVAQIQLNELDPSLSNESTADVGVQRYSNQSYTEERVKLGRTTFGSSPLAQRASRLIRKYRAKPSMGLR